MNAKEKITELQTKYPNLRFLATKDYPGLFLKEDETAYVIAHVESDTRINFKGNDDFDVSWFRDEARLQWYNDHGTMDGFSEISD